MPCQERNWGDLWWGHFESDFFNNFQPNGRFAAAASAAIAAGAALGKGVSGGSSIVSQELLGVFNVVGGVVGFAMSNRELRCQFTKYT